MANIMFLSGLNQAQNGSSSNQFYIEYNFHLVGSDVSGTHVSGTLQFYVTWSTLLGAAGWRDACKDAALDWADTNNYTLNAILWPDLSVAIL